MKTFECEMCHEETQQVMPMVIPCCAVCGKSTFMVEVKEKTDREKAIEWWKNLPDFGNPTNSGKRGLCTQFYNDRMFQHLTLKEIEEIWRKETQLGLTSEEWDEIFEEKKKVDFDIINSVFNTLKFLNDVGLGKTPVHFTENELNNLQLFFDMMSRSSSFAHKAHKELQRLNK